MSSKGRSPLILTALEGIPLVQQGNDLAEILLHALKDNKIDLIDGDVLVVAQKIISKAEGRKIDLNTITPSKRAEDLGEESGKDPREVELILRESTEVLRVRPGLIIVEHHRGFVCANAGIDHSNVPAEGGRVQDFVLLLPENPDKSAQELRRKVEEAEGVQIGVVINDSHGRAWRNGTVGISIGFSGLPGIVDLRGKPDLFDYQLRITQIAAVDELAGAASLLMGQADEGLPVVHVRGFPYPLRDGSFQELPREGSKDLFR